MSSPRRLWSFAASSPPDPFDPSSSAIPSTDFPSFIPTLTTQMEDSDDENWADVDDEPVREKSLVFRSRPLFDRTAMEVSPLSSPTTSDTPSEDESEAPLTLHQPHPTYSPSIIRSCSLFLDDFSPETEQEHSTPSSYDREETPSPTPSLVPTIINTPPPSPKPHSCVFHAMELGIKVRDFAYESHDVPLAPVVPDLDQIKARYCYHRIAGLTPPWEVMEKLNDLDPEWLKENAPIFDKRAASNLGGSNFTLHPPRWRV